MQELDETRADVESDAAKLAVLYGEMVQMCLWGNATVCSKLGSISLD